MSEVLKGPAFGPAAGGQPRHLVVLLHGYGADGQDLIGLAPVWAQALPHALFVAPNAPAPCEASPFGYQWFSLEDLREAALRPQVERAADAINSFIGTLLARLDLDESRLALVGFSQGAMLTLEVGLRRRPAPAALLGFSGRLLGEGAPVAAGAPASPVLLVHGDADPVVPVAGSRQAAAVLTAAGVTARLIERPGLGHGIDQEGMVEGMRFLVEHLPQD